MLLIVEKLSHKLPINNFEWFGDTSQLNEDFIKNHNEEMMKDVQYLEKLHKRHNDLPFLPERMKLEKVVANLLDKTEHVIHIRNLKQTLNNGLVLK